AKPFVGIRRVLATHPRSHPKSAAPMGKLSPRFASTDVELMSQAIARDKAFLNSYRKERQRWLLGKKQVTFPCGTVWLRRNAPIMCRAPDPDQRGRDFFGETERRG
ncbi:MAG: hypothetical protein ACNA8W_25205, partial [Bradymonadaceae bacterium]